VPEQALRYGLEQCAVVMSVESLAELERGLKLKLGAPYKFLRASRQCIERVATVVQTEPLDIVRDPSDNHLVAAALQENCDYLVTGDNDLLVLGSINMVQIVSPADFLEQMN